MERGDRQGEEFRTDLRPLVKSVVGSGNASARRILSAAELAPLTELGTLVATGKMKYRETIANGVEAAPEAFLGLLKGRNFGKQLVKLT